MDIFNFFVERHDEILEKTWEHLQLVGMSMGIAVLIGVPLGLLLTRKQNLAAPVIGFANVIQTVPSLALFGFLIPIPFIGGIGMRSATIALVLYALLPILRNTYIGIQSVDAAVVEAGVDTARARRGNRAALAALARGPGNLCSALGIALGDNGIDLLDPAAPVRLVLSEFREGSSGPRVGVSRAADRRWRLWLPGHPEVSAYRRSPRAPAHGESD